MQMGHFRRSTPTGGLEVISYTMPLDLYIIETALLSFLRTRADLRAGAKESTVRAPPDSYQSMYLAALRHFSLDQLPIDKVPEVHLPPHRCHIPETDLLPN